MFGKFLSLFKKEKIDFKKLLEDGALVLDVRSASEFKSGHIKGSKNISVQDLSNHLNKLDKDKTIITCCASGIRSQKAKNILSNKGFIAYNGGSWKSLQSKI